MLIIVVWQRTSTSVNHFAFLQRRNKWTCAIYSLEEWGISVPSMAKWRKSPWKSGNSKQDFPLSRNYPLICANLTYIINSCPKDLSLLQTYDDTHDHGSVHHDNTYTMQSDGWCRKGTPNWRALITGRIIFGKSGGNERAILIDCSGSDPQNLFLHMDVHSVQGKLIYMVP